MGRVSAMAPKGIHGVKLQKIRCIIALNPESFSEHVFNAESLQLYVAQLKIKFGVRRRHLWLPEQSGQKIVHHTIGRQGCFITSLSSCKDLGSEWHKLRLPGEEALYFKQAS